MSAASVACWACGAAAAPDPSWEPLRMYRCPACGLLFAPDRTPEELQSLYDAGYFADYPGGEDYEADPAQRRFEADRRVAWVARHVPGGRLLEIGAAAGHFVEAARDAGFEPMGVEPAADLARRATERTGITVVPGFLEDVDLPLGAFDVACAWHVVEHIAAPHDALVRVHDALAPGGQLFVEVPNIASVVARRTGRRWGNLDIRHHVGHYTPAALRALLVRAGFDVASVDTFPMRGYLRPGRAARPVEVAAAVKELAVVRANPLRGHPTRHELLRARAVRPRPGDALP
jgi:2-polyprenyl-3-methyl-5-hydroxy-6-metoxy-1,4-benzoquinol methylase